MRTPFYIVLLLAFGSLLAWGDSPDRCETTVAKITKNYPTANFESCEVIDENSFLILIKPEDEPINPSPWFGFSVTRKSDVGSQVNVTLKYLVAPHRYVPKYSFDKIFWEEISDDAINLIDEYTAELIIPQGYSKVYLSAQKILDVSKYEEWASAQISDFPFISESVIGYSVAKRPIHAYEINPYADRIILLLGRQHPPEVSGSIAHLAFFEELLSLKTRVGELDRATADGFFSNHMIVFIPLLNPDGVQEGYWRHNLQGVDLNRDWFSHKQPEIQTVVDYLAQLENEGKTVALVLDFHSTRRDVLYTQMPEDRTDPEDFELEWMEFVKERNLVTLPEYAPRPLTEQGTAKGYFFKTYGVPSITYEVGDESSHESVRRTAAEFALATVALYGDLYRDSSNRYPNQCSELYCFMLDANAASLVELNNTGMIESDLAGKIAQSQLRYAEQFEVEGWPSGQNYLNLEAFLIEQIGDEASNVHIGRSRQDLHGIARRMWVRSHALDFYGAVLEARESLVRSARQYKESVVPAYTHGVPSQPTTYGHQMLAFEHALTRDSTRLREAYIRLNKSQLGVAAGSGSGFKLNRNQLAKWLGFEEFIANTYDANFLSTADYKLEIASVISQSVATISKYLANIHAQQRNPRPWLYLADELVSGSSIMPQKRNPREIDRLRTLAADVLGDVVTQQLLNHNIDTGMHDYRTANPVVEILTKATSLFQRFAKLIEQVVVDEKLAEEDLLKGFSTSTEIADLLQRETGEPFRTTHEFAKQVVTHARDNGIRLGDVSDDDMKQIYRQVTGASLPIPTETIRTAIEPTNFVAVRRSEGGPALSAVESALVSSQAKLESDERWLRVRQVQLEDATYRLRKSMHELVPN